MRAQKSMRAGGIIYKHMSKNTAPPTDLLYALTTLSLVSTAQNSLFE
jgi:hypothetical protein